MNTIRKTLAIDPKPIKKLQILRPSGERGREGRFGLCGDSNPGGLYLCQPSLAFPNLHSSFCKVRVDLD